MLINMDIKDLRSKTGLSQRKFGERLGLQGQSILLYEKNERKVPESIKKLIRYEFAEFLPQEERLIVTPLEDATPVNFDDLRKIESLKKELEDWKAKYENLQRFNALQEKTISSLEEQIKLYKDRMDLEGGRSKTA